MIKRCLTLISLLFTPLAFANDLKIVEAARQQLGVTQHYDPQYTKLAYPNGDVDRSKGVCTDVVIRALRDAHQIDLQALVHQDMRQHFALYPKNWGLKKPDANIDHRRVPNLQVYFKRHWQSFMPPFDRTEDYQAGDVVTVMLPGNLPHIMLVSNQKERITQSLNAKATPLVIHNIGSGTKEEKGLFNYPITGHYRLQKQH